MRRLRRLPVRGRRPHPRAADRGARGGGGQVVRDRELGRARRRDDGERARRRGVARTSRSRATPTIHCSWTTSSPMRCEIERRHDRGLPRPRARRHARPGARRAPRGRSSSASPRSTTTSRATRRASARSSDVSHPEEEERQHVRQADRELPLEREISRRDLLKKAGRVGAGAVAAGALAGTAGAATKRVRRTTPRRCRRAAPSRGRSSRIPGFIAPFGAILTLDHCGERADVRLAARVGPEAQPPPGARSRATTSSTRSGSSGRSAPGRQVLATASESTAGRRRLLVPAAC